MITVRYCTQIRCGQFFKIYFGKGLRKVFYGGARYNTEIRYYIFLAVYCSNPLVTAMHELDKLQRWSRGHKARGQGHKKIRGQGQRQPFREKTLSRPRTGMLKAKDQGHKRKCSSNKKKVYTKIFQAISKKKVFTKFFQAISRKKVFQKNFQVLQKILTIQKIVLFLSRGQANFRGLEASRPRPRTSKCVLEDSTSNKLVKITKLK